MCVLCVCNNLQMFLILEEGYEMLPCPENGEVGINISIKYWMVSTKFYIYVFKFNSDGQIETSCGKEGVDYKKSWEHVWLMGNNQVLNSTNWIHEKWQIWEVSQ